MEFAEEISVLVWREAEQEWAWRWSTLGNTESHLEHTGGSFRGRAAADLTEVVSDTRSNESSSSEESERRFNFSFMLTAPWKTTVDMKIPKEY